MVGVVVRRKQEMRTEGEWVDGCLSPEGTRSDDSKCVRGP